MKCLDCSTSQGRATEAMGVCHHCSAGVCESDSALVSDPVTMQALIMRTVILPKRARVRRLWVNPTTSKGKRKRAETLPLPLQTGP